MQEYLTEAIVLDRENSGEQDLRVSLLTERFGKLTGKVKSGRKITSKLAGHLKPSFLVRARLVEKGALQIVDALKIGQIGIGRSDLARVKKVLEEAEADSALWHSLSSGRFLWGDILRRLGWDPANAACGACGAKAVFRFHIGSQEFFCKNCISGMEEDEVILL